MRKGKQGRHPTRKQVVEGEPVKVRKLVEELPEDAWNPIFLRDSEGERALEDAKGEVSMAASSHDNGPVGDASEMER